MCRSIRSKSDEVSEQQDKRDNEQLEKRDYNSPLPSDESDQEFDPTQDGKFVLIFQIFEI